MLNIVLYQPKIPQNTGNIIRLSANTGCSLHLIKPLGFFLDNKKLLRAGLDYHEWASVKSHDTIQAYLASTTCRQIAVETCGDKNYDEITYQAGDCLWFGAETHGLPPTALALLQPHAVVRIPQKTQTRSLNLSNSVAIVVYEALRQLGFSTSIP